MRVRALHPWRLSPAAAIAWQRRLAPRVVARGGPRAPRLVAGADVSYRDADGTHVACVLVWRPADGAVVERVTVRGRTAFPYVPGLLSFREVPILLRAFRRLRRVPDLVLCDAHGLAHPRRFGLACHLGLLLDLPTIGCAKSRLCGTHAEPGPAPGDAAPLRDRGETVGVVLRTRAGVRPVYVSAGHRVGLAAAQRLVLACGRGRRLPEPTRLADQGTRGP